LIFALFDQPLNPGLLGLVFIKRNLDVNTGDLKILHKKCQNMVDFLDIIFNFSKNGMCFAFNFMYDWRAVTKTVHLAPRYQGHSLSVQCYEFYLHAILFLKLIQTRPHIWERMVTVITKHNSSEIKESIYDVLAYPAN
jgi:hypothetical protein